MPQWFFERPSVGLDTGGDISKAFRGESHDLPGPLAQYDPGHSARLLARELIQNAVDAHNEHQVQCATRGTSPGGALGLHFEFATLDGADLRRFADAVDLTTMDDRADTVGSEELHLVEANYFDEGDTTQPLRILRVHERRTTGMYGAWTQPEHGDPERRLHSALLDFGISGKSDRAGGSYGYGKAALATASRLRMVFVYTCFVPRDDDPDGISRRLLGVTYWDKHSYNNQVVKGVGIFGDPFPGRDDLANPINDDAADALAEALGLPIRSADNPNDLGSSFVIVDPDFGAEAIQRSIELFWWPALRRGTVEVTVEDMDSGQAFPPRPSGYDGILQPFVTALTWLDDSSSAPPTDDPAAAVVQLKPQEHNRLNQPLPSPGSLALLVDQEEDSWSWADPSSPTLVALIRGTNMVIAYHEQRTGLPCARGVFNASEEADPLLRATETKAHDKWESKRDPGIPARASQMADVTKTRIQDAVRKFVGDLKPSAPKREIALEHFGSFFTGKRGSTPPPPKATRDAWTIKIDSAYADPPPADPTSLRQEGTVTLGLSGNTALDKARVTVELRFGAAEDDSGFGTEGLEIAATPPKGWTVLAKQINNPASIAFEGTLERGSETEFRVESGEYPASWVCGFQAIVTPEDGGNDEA